MEKQLIEHEGIPYHGISAGKLRRYLDVKNFSDLFRIAHGFTQAIGVIKKVKPDVVFSKGGFVSCPVVWAAWLFRIPVLIHESDMTPGLANKLALPFARKICYTFPETGKYIAKDKGIFTGIPIRLSLFSGNADTGRKLCGFNAGKPVIMVIGGSLGSGRINEAVRTSLKTLLNKYQICHICGKGNIDQSYSKLNGYMQFEYVSGEQPHLFAMADIVVSRAGSTTIHEILALKKPNLLIPLPSASSRGDQIQNALSFEKQGFSLVLPEERLVPETFVESIDKVFAGREKHIRAMNAGNQGMSTEEIIKLITKYAGK
jgi:UDP-N-acetylglucosamine--N-acetylmuramyl-(pentapeptide) pyrophosphoryl-undecaprenol N-acetylglucosamine transferase